MLPEKKQEQLAIEPSTEQIKKTTTVLLGGDSMISPILGPKNKVEGYEVILPKPDGGKVTFRISKQQGEDLISARLSMLASEVAQDKIISDEAFQSLLPAHVADEYRKRMIAMGTPEEEIPRDPIKIFEKVKAELVAYRELGREQIANDAQQIADELISITKEVLSGNNFRYNNLPAEFKKSVEFLRPTFEALAVESAGITEETVRAQKMALAINLMTQEKYRDMWMDHIRTVASTVAATGGDSIGLFIGSLVGSAIGSGKGAVETAYEKTKELFRSPKKK